MKHLGDSIHAYFVIKKLNEIGIESKLLTNSKWHAFFEEKYITKSIPDGIDFVSIDGSVSPIKYPMGFTVHSRDKILNLFTINNKAYSSQLNIKPKKLKSNAVMLCQRSSNCAKSWNGDWKAVENYLKKLGYDVIYDNESDTVIEFVKNIINSKFIISVDTSAVHIAEAYDIPVIGLYGLTLVNIFGPYTNSHHCISKSNMNLITLEDIIEKISNII